MAEIAKNYGQNEIFKKPLEPWLNSFSSSKDEKKDLS